MCLAYRLAGVAPIVRIASPNPYEACKAIDGGAQGVIAPYIETREQVRSLVGAVKYRPVKGKKLQDLLDAQVPFEPKLADYISAHNRENVVIANIESTHAIDALDSIVSEPGLDSILIGPHDLSCSLSAPEEYDLPEFESAVQRIIEIARAHAVGAGIHSWMGLERETAWAKSGANLLIHSSDIFSMSVSLGTGVRNLRVALNDERAEARAYVDSI